jgi:hypothetical protein
MNFHTNNLTLAQSARRFLRKVLKYCRFHINAIYGLVHPGLDEESYIGKVEEIVKPS